MKNFELIADPLSRNFLFQIKIQRSNRTAKEQRINNEEDRILTR